MSKQDRQGARTASDLEYRYAFGKSFAEVMGIATDARNFAEEAKKVSAGLKESNDGLALSVKSLEDSVRADLEMAVKTDKDGNLTSEMHVGAGKMTVDTKNFQLDKDGNAKFSGELDAASGTFDGSVTSVSERHGYEQRVSLANGVMIIKSPIGFTGVGTNIHYFPVIEFTNGIQNLVLALSHDAKNDSYSTAVLPRSFFYED